MSKRNEMKRCEERTHEGLEQGSDRRRDREAVPLEDVVRLAVDVTEDVGR